MVTSRLLDLVVAVPSVFWATVLGLLGCGVQCSRTVLALMSCSLLRSGALDDKTLWDFVASQLWGEATAEFVSDGVKGFLELASALDESNNFWALLQGGSHALKGQREKVSRLPMGGFAVSKLSA